MAKSTNPPPKQKNLFSFFSKKAPAPKPAAAAAPASNNISAPSNNNDNTNTTSTNNNNEATVRSKEQQEEQLLNSLIRDFGGANSNVHVKVMYKQLVKDYDYVTPLRILSIMRQYNCNFEEVVPALLVNDADFSVEGPDTANADDDAFVMDVDNNNIANSDDDDLPDDVLDEDATNSNNGNNNEEEGADIPNNDGIGGNVDEGVDGAAVPNNPIVVRIGILPQFIAAQLPIQLPNEAPDGNVVNNNNNIQGLGEYFYYMENGSGSESDEEDSVEETISWGITNFRQKEYRININIPPGRPNTPSQHRTKKKTINKNIGRNPLQTPEQDRLNAIMLMERINNWFYGVNGVKANINDYTDDQFKEALDDFVVSLNAEDPERYGFCIVPVCTRTETVRWLIFRKWYIETRPGGDLHADTLAALAQEELDAQQGHTAIVAEAAGNPMDNITSVLTLIPSAMWVLINRFRDVADMAMARMTDPQADRDAVLYWGDREVIGPIYGSDSASLDFLSEINVNINFNPERDAIVWDSAGTAGFTTSPRYIIPYQSKKSMMIYLMFQWMKEQDGPFYNQSQVSTIVKSILDHGEEGRLFVLSVATEGPEAQEHNNRYVCRELVRNDNDSECQIFAAALAVNTRGSSPQNGFLANTFYRLRQEVYKAEAASQGAAES